MQVRARLGYRRPQLGKKRLDELGARRAQGHGSAGLRMQRVGRLQVLRVDAVRSAHHERERARPVLLGKASGIVRNIAAPTVEPTLAGDEPRQGLAQVALLYIEDAPVSGVVRGNGAGKAVNRVGRQGHDFAVGQRGGHAGHDVRIRCARIHAQDLLGGHRRCARKLALANGHEHARATGKVLANLDRGPSSGIAHEVGGLIEVSFIELAAKHATGAQGTRRELEQAAEHIEAVGAAVQRELGLVVLDLGGNLLGKHRRGNVGRVAHQHGEGARKHRVDPGCQVALHELDRVGKPERIAVARGEVDGRGREIRGHDLRAPPLIGDGKRDAARAAPHLQHAARQPTGGGRGCVHALERGVYQHLRLGTGNQDALLAAQDDVAEGRLARDVLQRLAGGPALNGLAHASTLVLVQGLVVIDVKLDAREAHDVAEQPLGREPRMLVAVALEITAGPIDDLLDVPGLLVGLGRHRVSPRCLRYRIITNGGRGGTTFPAVWRA